MSTGDDRNATLSLTQLFSGEGEAFIWREHNTGAVYVVLSEFTSGPRKVAGVRLDRGQAEELGEALLLVAGVPR
jgi:hypothetical protein